MGLIMLQRILLADDEPDILEISRIALETVGGYEVAVCESGSEFLRLLAGFDPDLVENFNDVIVTSEHQHLVPQFSKCFQSLGGVHCAVAIKVDQHIVQDQR